jgi:apolipoprotein N-acyltransferase
MNQKQQSSNIYHALIAILCTGAFLFFATGLADYWPLLWLAPTPVLIYALTHKRLESFIVAIIAFTLGSFAAELSLYWGTIYPIYAGIFGAFFNGVFFGIVVILTRRCAKRLPAWLSVFSFASLWCAYQFIWALMHNGNLTNTAVVSQMPALPLMQILSITGIWGLCFLINAVGAGIAFAWHYRHHKRACTLALTLPIILLLATTSYGEYRLDHAPQTPSITVGMAARNPTSIKAFIKERDTHPIQTLKSYITNINALAASGAHYILQPEKVLAITPKNQKVMYGALAASAKKNHVTLFVGAELIKREKPRNTLLVFGKTGKLIAQYNKEHLVLPFERHFIAGRKPVTLTLDQYLIALAICHDLDFTHPVNAYGKQNAQALFAPAEDFGVLHDGRWHMNMARMSSIMNGYALVRAGLFGFLSTSDAYGQLISLTPTQSDATVTVTAHVPLGTGHTFYSQHDDWFGIASIVLALVLLGVCSM